MPYFATENYREFQVRLRLLLASLLFAVWLGFLIYQTVASANPPIVSRPQVLTAKIVVEGVLLEDPIRVRFQRVWWGEESVLGKELAITNLSIPEDHTAGKSYVIPLEPAGEDLYQVADIPQNQKFVAPAKWPGIYPATDSVRQQLRELLDFRRSNQRGDNDDRLIR